MKQSDTFWMMRCLQLAKRGIGYVSPNPLVGSVIIKEGKIIAEGYHQRFGGKHAEIEAIQQALEKKYNLNGATLYVNLEPCFHFGKTPPCVDAIIKHKIARVVIATLDPNPLVAGKSVKKLKECGIKVTVGICKKESELLNEKFFKFITTKVPFVALKAAQTYDGFIAQDNGDSKWITNAVSRRFVHKLRSEYDAIVVGATTVRKDNPFLTVRGVRGKNPVRVLIDGNLTAPMNSHIFNSDTQTIVFTKRVVSRERRTKISELRRRHVIVVETVAKNGKILISSILKELAQRNIASLFVEGGQEIYDQFIKTKNVDKLYLFTAKKKFLSGIKTFKQNSVSWKRQRIATKKFNTDRFEEFKISFS